MKYMDAFFDTAVDFSTAAAAALAMGVFGGSFVI